jgi:hypothetical protein
LTDPRTAELLREYKHFEALTPIFIGGVRRSGTTLLQRMLDGHPQLLVYPLEDCIVRDSFFQNRLFQLHRLQSLLDSRDARAVLSYMTSNPKLALSLEPRIDSRDEALAAKHLHLGHAQVIENELDRHLFEYSFLEIFSERRARQWGIADAVRVWMFSFFRACDVTDLPSYVGWVTKCPDEGRCFALYIKLFPKCRVIYVARDPRGFYASESHKGGKQAASSRSALGAGIQLWASGVANLRQAQQISQHSFTWVRYEDLLKKPEPTIRTIADFLGIDYSNSLLEPTFGGRPWGANTSFQNEPAARGLLLNRAEHWRDVLTLKERALIEGALYKEMVAFGYVSRVRGSWWWFRLLVISMMTKGASRLLAAVRFMLARARRR